LRRFVNQESRVYLNRFYRIYRGRRLTRRWRSWRIAPARRAALAVVFNRSGRKPAGGARWLLARYLRAIRSARRSLGPLSKIRPSQFSLQDRGYLAGIHPLELWLVAYLQNHPARRGRGYEPATTSGKMPMPGSSRAAADTSRSAHPYIAGTGRVRQDPAGLQQQGYRSVISCRPTAVPSQLRRPARRARRFDRHNSQ